MPGSAGVINQWYPQLYQNLPAATSGLSGQFVKLSVNEPEQSLNLQKVTLKFIILSISMHGQIKSSVSISVVKTLEKIC